LGGACPGRTIASVRKRIRAVPVFRSPSNCDGCCFCGDCGNLGAGLFLLIGDQAIGADVLIASGLHDSVPNGLLRELILLALRDVPRGRNPAEAKGHVERLHSGMDLRTMTAVFEAAHPYDDKLPDVDLEEKLRGVDWERDPILLYVGRLISTKGVHAVVAALPLLLEQHPELRLLLVGHGPLREPLEGMIDALSRGDRELLERIVAWGRGLEGSPEGEGAGESESRELTQVARYLDSLHRRGEIDHYFDAAARHLRPDRVVFTGYLTHRELRYLFPCTDLAVFPSVVPEAGPLVFLEAMASGAFPLGTYFGGMRASIDSVADALPTGAGEAMKLSADPERTVEEIVRNVPVALRLSESVKETLFELARDRYDWAPVAAELRAEMETM